MSLDKILKIAYDPIYAHPLPEGHRFPMLKYELIPEQLLYEGSITADNIFSPAPCADEIILLTHDKEYLDKLHQQTLSAASKAYRFPPISRTNARAHHHRGNHRCCNYTVKTE
jgi:acetoin utilization deacetylase AcuC-like enzyme